MSDCELTLQNLHIELERVLTASFLIGLDYTYTFYRTEVIVSYKENVFNYFS